MRILIFFLFLILQVLYDTGGVNAQSAQTGVAGGRLMPSSKRVLVMINTVTPETKSLNIYGTYNRYEVFKDVKGNGSFKKVASLTFPASYAEFEKRAGSELAAAFKQKVNARNNEEAYRILLEGSLSKAGYFFLSDRFLQAIGMIWADEDISSNTLATTYRISGVTGNRISEIFSGSLSSVKRVPFPKFKLQNAVIADSVVQLTWAAGIPKENPAIFSNVFRKQQGEKAFSIAAEKSVIYQRNDSLYVYYSEEVKPGQLLTYYMSPLDMGGNTGINSDTSSHLSKSFKSITTINRLSVKDTSNALHLTWEPLPRQAVYSGIQVLKSRRAQDNFVVADTLPPDAVSYSDNKVLPNVVYYYQVRPLLISIPGWKMLPPATAHGLLKVKSEIPSQPWGLAVRQDSTNAIVLSWKKNPELDLFAYYVLRGTSMNNLEVISGPLRDTMYTDSLKRLSASTEYVYALQVMNQSQNMSERSDPVSIRPVKAQYVAAPAGVQAGWRDQAVNLSWDNTIAVYENTVGYILFRRIAGETYFKTVSTVLTQPFYRDTTVSPGVNYEYGVTSLDAWGNQSILSPVAQITIPVNDFVVPPASFYLSNKSDGIQLNWPSDDQKGKCVIYRKEAGGEEFEKISTVGDQGLFLDKNVKSGVLYIYKLSIVVETSESMPSTEKTIRRP